VGKPVKAPRQPERVLALGGAVPCAA